MIGRFCHDDRCVALHVSIAGGRKTMGFFAGYAYFPLWQSAR
ncbi:hypothetical protein INT80_05445 [Gallibacterium anatis]|uniref:CRISPR system ring nuclease SSO2081-like domain-containing protein n=1 Tax=Gallibacterium anatis TaxID=750 RepID=A0A930UR88_9PAST|nr:hypothetical protein [Gallibacterium anatis]